MGRLTHLSAMLRILSDWPSRLRFVRLRLVGGDEPVPLRLRPLGDRELWVRPHTSDAQVVVEDFVHGFADPPDEVAGRPLSRVVELGSNIGVGLALLAERFPESSVLGVEADPANATLARRNIAPWSDRVRLVEAAVWEGPGEPVVERAGAHETGFRVRGRGTAEDGNGTMPAVRVGDLLSDFSPTEPIDYLYMDIEGHHEPILRGEPEWVERVRAIKVSRHLETDYSEEDCARDLERLGFRTRVILLEPTGWTIGVREE
jgi:FkbM family methyltransferase